MKKLKREEICRRCPDKWRRWHAMPGNYGSTVYIGRSCRETGLLRWCIEIEDDDQSHVYNDVFVNSTTITECLKKYEDYIVVNDECPFYAEFFLNDCCNEENDDE